MLGGYKATEDQYDAAAYSASSRSTLETIHSYDKDTLSEYGMVVLRDVSYTATQHEMLSKEQINKTDYAQFGTELNWQGEDWKLHGLAGYSGAEKTLDYSNLKHVAYAPSRTRWTADGGETIKSANPASIDMYNSPSKYLFEAYETTLEKITDDKYAAQLDFTKDFALGFFPALKTIQVGARYTDKSKERQYGALNIQGPSKGSTAWLNTRTMADSPLTLIGDLVPGGSTASATSPGARSPTTTRARPSATPASSRRTRLDNYYKVDETVTSLYAMADLGFDVGTVPVVVNGGVRTWTPRSPRRATTEIQDPDWRDDLHPRAGVERRRL